MLQICGANFVLHDVIVLVYANMFTLWNLCHKIIVLRMIFKFAIYNDIIFSSFSFHFHTSQQ
jgi:hypothetical protein